MSNVDFRFILPIGYEDAKGEVHREGKMRLATAADELAIHAYEKTAFNARLRDLFLLTRVITKLGDKTELNVEDLEELFETDFLFLQTLFRTINSGDSGEIQAVCPHCGQETHVPLQRAFEDMAYQFAEKPETVEVQWSEEKR